MTTRTPRLIAVALATGLATGGLFAAGLPAGAAVSSSVINSYGDFGGYKKDSAATLTCPDVIDPVPPVPEEGLPGNADDVNDFNDDGATVTKPYSYGATITNSENPADTIRTTATGSTAVRFTQSGGSFASFDVGFQGTATVAPALGASSACSAYAGGTGRMYATITVSQPGWVHVDVTTEGTPSTLSTPGWLDGYMELYKVTSTVINNHYQYRDFDGTYFYAAGLKSNQTHRVFVTPGTYRVYSYFTVTASTAVNTHSNVPEQFTASATHTGSFHLAGTFAPAGAKDGKAVSVAKGKRYVQLQNRNCVTDKITAKLNKKRLKAASKVVFKVNGKTKKTVKLSKKFPKKGLVQLGPIADADAAKVLATVYLKEKGAARPTLEQSYLACS